MKPAQRRNLALQQHRQAWEQERRRERDEVIAEFENDTQAMAREILRLRAGVNQLEKAINWLKLGGPFGMIGPGPYWRPKGEGDEHQHHIDDQ
jgi:hypothetical protein